ncbi:ROK family protein [Micropruina glycogenica]|uniref:Sugar kinase n=1 Tax=Micropruina glycogenica TaxID=75385 RepID=A0A2N9JEM0_9ACTN|nr:ROK family protein [Micropruina glycogenica]SPD85826.1 Sugar kinase [Micropruina glycogenica]
MTAPQCSGPSLGIDIGGTKTQAVLLDASSRVIANRVRRTDRGPDGVVGGALALARECLQLGRTQVTELMGVGVGIPGQVDHCSGVVLHAVNLGIERLELGALLSAELGVAVRVDNDVKATALGAADYLRTPTADLSYINLGTGIASATLVGGRLVRGEGNLAGEIGHLPVDPSAGRCVCGQIGCLEVLAGGRRIAERLAAAGLTLPGLVEATHAGDQAAIDESLRIGGAIATAVQLVVLAHGSARVALGGGVVRTAPGLVDLARRQLTERAAGSDFLASLDLPARITLLPGNHPLAAIGAALVGRGAQCHDPSIVCASDPAALGRSDR